MAIEEQLMDRLFESPQLPSLPTIALQIIALVQEDEVDIDKIAQTISLDPALSTKMLKTVNSSFYGMSKTIGSVHQAVVVLGLNSVKTLALGFSLVSNLTEAGGDYFDHMGFWRRSLYSATAAKQLCELLNIVQAEEVFMASLLQDVGVLALAQVLGREYAPMVRQAADDHRRLAPMERERLGSDHIEVGAKLAQSWGLPPLLVESIRLHETPDDAPENLRPLIQTVAAGGLAADLIEDPVDESRVTEYFSVLQSWFGMDQDVADKLLRDVFKHASEAQRLFELPTGDLANPDDILAKAKEVLHQLARKENHAKLNEPAVTDAGSDTQAQPAAGDETAASQAAALQDEDAPARDAVTGLNTRSHFEKLLDEQFALAGADRPVSVMFIDIDTFKKTNDLYGSQAGDGILREVGQTIEPLLSAQSELFRFEDDSFILLCPGTNQQDAAVLAETIRTQIELAQFNVVGDATQRASLTASIGVVTYDGIFFKRSDQLVKAASKGVHAAKGGGCNLVRVFVPRKVKPDSEAA